MRLLISIGVGAFATFVFFACKSTDKNASSSPAGVASSRQPVSGQVKPAATAPQDGVRRMTVVELQDLLAKGQAVVVDVRNEASYKAGHIPGAKLIPTNEFLNRLNELPPDRTIVTYCS